MTPKQEKFLIAKFQEVSKTLVQLRREYDDLLAFLIPRGYKPPVIPQRATQ